ncbi:DUF4434 domain-containing protein [Jejubacter calystegiae]|uniref:DUF4434 domain-containing protein n=1 Tax=Jejubacter calystegiae TaxID=2579935 RepID=A0A4P8YK93_9ENTR|nr:DUF4434 domain-containing protein [Jejubacter calystegiae]QCT20386.1 DUF4434 domain-containing protein [Jejubacter calystegiae]
MKRLLSLLLCATLAFSAGVQAMTAVIYQPQLRDRSVALPQWQQLMGQLRLQGFDTLVLQWTRYGDAFNDRQGQKWLMQRADAARQAGLKLIVGLHADPDFFTRQIQPPAAQENYLNQLLFRDLEQARQWLTAGAHIDGWYLSAEVDDLHWRTDESREKLMAWLSSSRRQLATIADRPVAISSFFAGNMTPDGYRQLVSEMAATGVRIWVQDGAGVGKLSATERQLYLDRSLFEGAAPGAGVVYEIFRQTSGADASFSARPVSEQEFRQIWNRSRSGSQGKDRLFFSLRYLPQARGILAY